MQLSQKILDQLTSRNLDIEQYVVIHHTAGLDMNEDIVDIAKEEIADQDFVTVGYHFVIHGSGEIQVGRPIDKVPAANLGLNTPSIAIALEGNFQPLDVNYTGEQPTQAQLDAVVKIVNEWVKPKCKNLRYLIGHRDVARIVNDPSDATACPGDLLYMKLGALRRATGLQPK